jgi:DNA-binding response OmpR family regulator
MSDKPITILLAEDNPGDVYLVRLALQESGLDFSLVEVSDGEQALRYLDLLDGDPSAACPSIVLLDLNLPRFDGKRVLQRLKMIDKCSNTRTIVLTSSEYPTDRSDVEKLGADCYFHKPQDLDMFLRLGDLVAKIWSGDGSASASESA